MKILQLKRGEVDLIVSHITELGINVLLTSNTKACYIKMKFYDAIRTGDRMRGYIKTVRPDNKIDVSLQIQGYEVYQT
jgi:predicted RNA-binding protein (virulence factor B family)